MTSTETNHPAQSLGYRLILRCVIGFLLVAAMLFLPAGSLRFWQGWMLLAVSFIPVTIFCWYMSERDPQLMERRLQKREPIRAQRVLVRSLRLVFFAVFLVPGFDQRWGWSRRYIGTVPLWLTLLSQATVLLGLLFVFWVFRTNTFASRTIQVEADQKVISSGPYRFVRHPMYLGSLIIWISVPLALSSYIALPFFLLLIPFYVFRLLHEEQFLRRQLPGYSEYCEHTRFHLIPGLW